MPHLSVFLADSENHTKGDSPKTSSASGPQEQMWRGSQAQGQTQVQVQVQAQAQALSSVKLQIQPQNIPQRNHTLSREYESLHVVLLQKSLQSVEINLFISTCCREIEIFFFPIFK